MEDGLVVNFDPDPDLDEDEIEIEDTPWLIRL